MLLATVKLDHEAQLRALAQNSQSVSAISPRLQAAVPGQAQAIAVGIASPLVLSSQLPTGVRLPATRQQGTTDYDTLKIVAQEMLLPAVSTIWPAAKPYVSGVQAIWATVEFWEAITDKEVDATKRTIKGVRAAQKAVNALLTFQGAPTYATNTNIVAGFMIATADKLYVVRQKANEPNNALKDLPK